MYLVYSIAVLNIGVYPLPSRRDNTISLLSAFMAMIPISLLPLNNWMISTMFEDFETLLDDSGADRVAYNFMLGVIC